MNEKPKAITTHDLGISVYGVPQVGYSADGKSGLDFGDVISHVTLKQATIADNQTRSVSSAIRLRQKQLEAMGRTLAIVNGILAKFRVKGGHSKDEYTIEKDKAAEILQAADELKKYGYTLKIVEETKKTACCGGSEYKAITITRATAMRAQAEVQTMIDTENNNMQQDMMTVQGVLQKRDRAFDGAQDMIKGFYRATDGIIRTMN